MATFHTVCLMKHFERRENVKRKTLAGMKPMMNFIGQEPHSKTLCFAELMLTDVLNRGHLSR